MGVYACRSALCKQLSKQECVNRPRIGDVETSPSLFLSIPRHVHPNLEDPLPDLEMIAWSRDVVT